MIYIAIFVILLLIVIIRYKNEAFISYTANLSEYGPQPFMIVTRYIPNNLKYSEIDNYTKYLQIMEIFLNQTYKIYSDDGFIREGIIPEYLWNNIKLINKLAINYSTTKYCHFIGNDLTYHYIWANGYIIDLGIFAEKCVPYELLFFKNIYELMDVEMNRY